MTFYIAIIDYDMGNLKSVSKLLTHLNTNSIISSDADVILDADGVILPGVGAFGDAMKNIQDKKLLPVLDEIVKLEKPLFGICLGLQLLFSRSYEMGEHKGLDYIHGKVISFKISKVDKIPQIGWNSVHFEDKDHFLIQNIPNDSYFYFVHSYYCLPKNETNLLGSTIYGETEFCSVAYKDNIVATQFHPEKSSKLGIQMYENFISFCKK